MLKVLFEDGSVLTCYKLSVVDCEHIIADEYRCIDVMEVSEITSVEDGDNE